MISSTTGEDNTGVSQSLDNLGNLHKGREPQRIYQSEPFLKPVMSLKQVGFIKAILSSFKFKCSESVRENKTPVPKDLEKSMKKGQMFIRDNSIRNQPQKNKSQLPHLTHQEEKSEKAGGLPIPKEEWKTLTRSPAKVILDLNTANPTLKLSADGRSVRTKTHKEFHSEKSYYDYLKKSKHKYDGWMCVQAQEGYSTGKHYWEVDVTGKCDWRIGVVKESAQRNGFTKLNTAAGYWTLRLQVGSLLALTEPVTKLNQEPPSKIGVYLDLEEGQVSFCDAVKRKVIYTFKAEFSKCEKLYPVFGTVETDKPLKIIQT
ncbi:butyrophilin subfamily 3 member A1-like isoform X1 [Neoarius graeffei]|uniref:butyrophilin subfamily 3 member A1-like isoform X1 n=1 Tax=Neoarius graeffei TaxID=443677 RepID=UPI00298CD256|nr:butyrophilin subfamily 3 member A1-like isoform X1 [Neoarius graeffei]